MKRFLCLDYWEARDTARKGLLSVIGAACVFDQGINIVRNVEGRSANPALYAILLCATAALCVRRAAVKNNTTWANKISPQVFSLFIGAVSIIGCAQFCYVATFGDLATTTFNAFRILIKKLDAGRIPMDVPLLQMLPLIATPAGMNAKIAKFCLAINLIIFGVFSAALFRRLDKSCHNSSCTKEDRSDLQMALINEVWLTLVGVGIAYFSCLPGAEISSNFVELLRSGQTADSVLNHIIKNSIAGAACLIELEQEESPDPPRERIAQALEELYISMNWCSSRQVFVDLAAGTYTSTLSPVNLKKLMKSMIKNGKNAFSFSESVHLSKDQSVFLDEKLARVALENAVTNAVAHGEEGGLIKLVASVENGGLSGDMCVFTVENQLPPGSALTQKILSGISRAATRSPSGAAGDTFQAPVATRLSSSAKGNSLGLRHMYLACAGAGGSFKMTLNGDKSCVEVAISLPVRISNLPIARKDVSTSLAAEAAAVPSGIGNNHPLKRAVTPKSAHCAPSLPTSTVSAPPTLCKKFRVIEEGVLRVHAIDDSQIICKGYSKLLFPKLKVDVDNSTVMCPTSITCVETFIDNVMKFSTGASLASGTLIDIVILDQNIEIQDTAPIYGTDVAMKLKNLGYAGLVIIRSANDSVADCESYLQTGAVDSCLGKNLSPSELEASIRKALITKRANVAYGADTESHDSPWLVDFVQAEEVAIVKNRKGNKKRERERVNSGGSSEDELRGAVASSHPTSLPPPPTKRGR